MQHHQFGGSPFGPGIHFNLNGQRFGGNRRRRAPEEEHNGGRVFQLIQLIPFLLMLFFSFGSSIFGPTDYSSYYSLQKTYKFSYLRNTVARSVPYYVPKKFKGDTDTRFLHRVEETVEREYISALQTRCWREREHQRALYSQANGFWVKDEAKMQAAKNMVLHSCVELAKFGNYWCVPFLGYLYVQLGGGWRFSLALFKTILWTWMATSFAKF